MLNLHCTLDLPCNFTKTELCICNIVPGRDSTTQNLVFLLTSSNKYDFFKEFLKITAMSPIHVFTDGIFFHAWVVTTQYIAVASWKNVEWLWLNIWGKVIPHAVLLGGILWCENYNFVDLILLQIRHGSEWSSKLLMFLVFFFFCFGLYSLIPILQCYKQCPERKIKGLKSKNNAS